MKKRKSHDRAAGMTQTTVALPNDLLKRIGAAARSEGRTRNNWMNRLLVRAIDEYEKDPHRYMEWTVSRRKADGAT